MSVGVMKDYKLKLGIYAPRIHCVVVDPVITVKNRIHWSRSRHFRKKQKQPLFP
jgi:hypothetical protein